MNLRALRSYEREAKEQWRAIEDGEWTKAVRKATSLITREMLAAGVLVDAYVGQSDRLDAGVTWQTILGFPSLARLGDDIARTAGRP